MNINEAIEQLKYYQNKPYVPTVRKVCDIALETIESQQQENEQLRAQVARMRRKPLMIFMTQCNTKRTTAGKARNGMGNGKMYVRSIRRVRKNDKE